MTATTVTVDGVEVAISSPDRVLFPEVGLTKRDLVDFYVEVADVLMPHCRDRPCNLERHPRGVGGPSFVQKRLPDTRPSWLGVAEVTFGSGNTAIELCPTSVADVVWAANLGAITVHPWSLRVARSTRASGTEAGWNGQEPDELRIDLDPMPDVPFAAVRRVAAVCREVLAEDGIDGFVKTSGASGLHVIARIEPRPYLEVRAAAGALAREVERRTDEATSAWWRRQRGPRVFIDYNQNLWDRSMACAYAVRATPGATVSLPVTWDELDDVEPDDATVTTTPDLLARRGDPMATLDEQAHPLDRLLERVSRDRSAGLGELPMPPHYPKLPSEPRRAPPSD